MLERINRAVKEVEVQELARQAPEPESPDPLPL
jgi:hypothetical protein